ncbi:CDP-diacylglycerol pyrophosphatase [Methylocella tundrae]|uniref:CDP-diacylglycerol pyrophosphatase n=1 Tax=Methylocella tundrae TaxID=227605 RepID=A0A8B6M0I4_METTU|nr:CDP-diacylglycerol diphosphatase [Methylocella tundrae]VTZ26088.1 CDP-diacylglycerol pyrophosphatase [Methylocella tundrae]VTZ48318.1 CDP-diacylglycerol pyrophosphatase [Methylocella tundrae]
MLIETPPAPAASEAKSLRRFGAALGAICLIGAAAIGVAAASDPNALWSIVHGLCVFDKTHLHTSAPCASVDLEGGEAQGSAVLKDILGKTQFLLIPTRRLTGIEDPLIGTDGLPNYWSAAWDARNLVAKNARRDLSRDEIGMAINGAGARTQDQLHIHIDCVRPDVRDALAGRSAEIGAHWADFTLLGARYRARRIDGEAPDPDPFRLLAEDKRSAPLSEDSLAVIGARFSDGKPGFVLLAEQAPRGAVHTENLLDHSCAVAAR